MDLITIDFETYYSKDFSLSKITTEEYINSDEFEVIGVAVKVNDEKTRWFTGTMQATKSWLEQFDWKNSAAVAHNMLFDGAILGWRFNIHPKALFDTLSMARAIHGTQVGGSLAKLVAHYKLGEKGTEVVNALGLRRTNFSIAALEAYAGYCINDVELTHALFKKLMAQFPMQELKVIDMTLRMFTQPVLQLDLEELESHLDEVQAKKERLLQACAQDRSELMSNDKFAELLMQLGVMPPQKVSARTNKLAWAFAKTDEEFRALEEHPDLRVQALVAARLGTKSTIEETRTERFINIAKRSSVLPVPLQYYGAKTGRWSATDSINLQNIPRTSRMKKAIQAPPGHVILGADLSNIELRVGLWLAGQMDKLHALGKGVDLYKDFAAAVFGVRYEDVTKDQRFIGKTSQLSLIYGVGHVKLHGAIKTGSGKDIGTDEAQRIVNLYRQDYAKVKTIWGMGAQALEAMENNQAMRFGQNDFFSVEGRRGIRLPSGLYMQYPDLRGEDTDKGRQWTCANRNGRERVYGAKVFQGLTQATARCIIAEQMLRIQKRYPIALTIHDAAYLVVPESEADDAQTFVLEQMRIAPDWIPGIPLDAEAGYGPTLADA